MNMNTTLSPSLLRREILISTDLILRRQKLNYLLLFAPLAIVGKSYEWLGESSCFVLAGLALIPLAEVSLFFFDCCCYVPMIC